LVTGMTDRYVGTVNEKFKNMEQTNVSYYVDSYWRRYPGQ